MSSLTPEDRKRRLDDARRALRSGNLRELKAALERLPETGTKADALRSELRARITGGPSALPLPLREPGRIAPSAAAIQASTGLRFRFVVARTRAATLLRTQMRGAVIEVAVNALHPAYRFIADTDGDLTGIGKDVLRAWATLHVNAGSERRRERVDDLAADWARALADLDSHERTDDEAVG